MTPSILLVDDNDDILEFLADELQEKYIVYKSGNGKEALNLLIEESVQLIISDVMMPDMDGFELCQAIKTSSDYCHIPIILLTAKNALQSKIEGLELGADAYIEKPFSPEYLQVQIANLLSNRTRVRDHFISSPVTDAVCTTYSKQDKEFLDLLNKTILNHLEDPELDVNKLAMFMYMSRPTLYRKVKNISNLTPHELINITRLKKSTEILTSGNHKIQEVANMVGYLSQTNFGKNFLKEFGMTPTMYSRKYSMQ